MQKCRNRDYKCNNMLTKNIAKCYKNVASQRTHATTSDRNVGRLKICKTTIKYDNPKSMYQNVSPLP